MVLENGGESIAIGFTDKKLSPHAGSAVFWKFLHPSGFIGKLKELLPHRLPESNNAIQPIDKAVAFVQGLLCGAEKLTHVAYLRRDPVVPAITGIKRVSSQSTLSRFFAAFDTAGKNQRCFGPMWEWYIKRIKPRKEGYSLDFDSTRLLHEDGHQEGVKTGYTRVGLKPCLHPLLAVLEEAKLVAGFWLRPGNTSCANNIEGFTLEVLGRLPKWLKVRVVRHEIKERKRAGGKKLIEVPGYLFQALVTNLSDAHRPLAVWRDYNKRAGCECVIKELGRGLRTTQVDPLEVLGDRSRAESRRAQLQSGGFVPAETWLAA